MQKIAIAGAGVTGLTCAAVLAERGYEPHIFASRDAESSTSGVAAAIWFPYDAEPPELAVAWGMISYGRFVDLTLDASSGVSLIECRIMSNEVPPWAHALMLSTFANGWAIRVPLIDSSIYLPWLRKDAKIHYGDAFTKLEEVDNEFDIIVNCTGIGARSLLGDTDLEPHRGQVVVVPKIDLPYAFVSDEEPLTYIIPRTNDCVFGGSNDCSDDTTVDPALSKRILDECSKVLGIETPKPIAERVGLRPYRKSGVRIDTGLLADGRRVIHNYGHGGAGFSLSWGCAQKVLELVEHYGR